MSHNHTPHRLGALPSLSVPCLLLLASGCMQGPNSGRDGQPPEPGEALATPAPARLEPPRAEAPAGRDVVPSSDEAPGTENAAPPEDAPPTLLASAEPEQDAALAPSAAEDAPDAEVAQSAEALSDDEASAASLAWRVELGTPEAPLGGVGLAGIAEGVVALAGTSASEAELGVYSSTDGSEIWTQRVAASRAGAVAAGNGVLLAGTTSGALDGPQQGFDDAFVAAYSRGGEPLWTRQIGTPEPDAALAVGTDASGVVLLAGETRGALDGAREGSDTDAFLARFDADGQLLHIRQLGSQSGYDETAVSVAVAHGGAAVIAGRTFGGVHGDGAGSADGIVARYSSTGELEWTAQFGGADYDTATAVSAAPSGAVFVAGQTGAFLAGPGTIVGGQPLLAKYSAQGELEWTRTLDDAEMGAASAVAVDADGDVWLAGYTSASFAGPGQGAYDSFVAHFSSDGARLDAGQFGVADNDRSAGLVLDSERLVLLSRVTRSSDGSDYSLLAGLNR